jgi:hypothetical protein
LPKIIFESPPSFIIYPILLGRYRKVVWDSLRLDEPLEFEGGYKVLYVFELIWELDKFRKWNLMDQQNRCMVK